MADLPITLSGQLAERLARALDREAKIPRALESLGPMAERDVLLVADTTVWTMERLADTGARINVIGANGLAGSDATDGLDRSADVLIVAWSAFRGPSPVELAAAERILRPGGRLLVLQDYGRDDVSGLIGERPEYGEWSRRDGPFLGNGFRIRVIHCWWTFDTLFEVREFLAEAFGEAGERLGAELTRPRLSYNIGVYHRTFDAA